MTPLRQPARARASVSAGSAGAAPATASTGAFASGVRTAR
jgi:hypothetical protein